MARESTRSRLYDAATALIAERGYSGTTVDEIAERAGVAKGTVYYNFPSKTALFEALLRHGVDQLTATLRAAVEGLHGHEALDALVRAELESVRRTPTFAQLLVAEMWRTGRAWQDTLRLLRDQVVAVFEEVLVDGVRRGAFSADLEPRLAASAAFGAVLVAGLDWLAFDPQRPLEEVHVALATMLRARVSG